MWQSRYECLGDAFGALPQQVALNHETNQVQRVCGQLRQTQRRSHTYGGFVGPTIAYCRDPKQTIFSTFIFNDASPRHCCRARDAGSVAAWHRRSVQNA